MKHIQLLKPEDFGMLNTVIRQSVLLNTCKRTARCFSITEQTSFSTESRSNQYHFENVQYLATGDYASVFDNIPPHLFNNNVVNHVLNLCRDK